MKGLRTAALAAILSSAAYLVLADDTTCENILSPSYPVPAVHPGWKAQLIMEGLVRPRTLEVDAEGALLILDAGVGIRRVTFTDHGSTCLEVDENDLLVDDDRLNHGMALSLDGRTIYASTPDSVYAWSYDPSTGSISDNRTTVVDGMQSSVHVTRTLLVSRHSPGYLVIARGSSDNLAHQAHDLDAGVSQVRAFNLNNTAAYPIDFVAGGRVLGWGLRNSVGIDEDPATGRIYAVETSIDDVERNGELIKEDNPAEELNYLGTVAEALEREDDADAPNFGYPVCYAVWEADDIPDHDGLEVGDQFSIETNSTLNDTTCSENYVSPRLSFAAHTVPLAMRFTREGSQAWITFHGSFNREDPTGYTLSVVQFNDGEPVEPATSHDSVTHIMSMADLTTCPDNCFRPMAIAWGPSGRVFLTSDSTGELYIIERRADGPSGTQSGTIERPEETGSPDGGDDPDSAAVGVSAVQSLGLAVAAVLTGLLVAM
ncbi:soluble quino protein glucose dehydrogenase [Sodiomyces alkalinus F11]|uniref:Soluble quino protein glucose dehydrogenase n=1 Tax=Sodiomyces alkalinus (strain CBS 110278 / VKM F-3762 / F11) TaxID=1314773 RepID=A0A3N2PU44_SODAK|nr:soluble quino protein glucose dehydrogenase [Sodiomyces alkalinus F11]ROT38019.1 soluble quino protein glucose dehydrogenase [Sodiomyces alkalinus F11]